MSVKYYQLLHRFSILSLFTSLISGLFSYHWLGWTTQINMDRSNRYSVSTVRFCAYHEPALTEFLFFKFNIFLNEWSLKIPELYKTHNMRFSATFGNFKKRERSGAKRPEQLLRRWAQVAWRNSFRASKTAALVTVINIKTSCSTSSSMRKSQLLACKVTAVKMKCAGEQLTEACSKQAWV